MLDCSVTKCVDSVLQGQRFESRSGQILVLTVSVFIHGNVDFSTVSDEILTSFDYGTNTAKIITDVCSF